MDLLTYAAVSWFDIHAICNTCWYCARSISLNIIPGLGLLWFNQTKCVVIILRYTLKPSVLGVGVASISVRSAMFSLYLGFILSMIATQQNKLLRTLTVKYMYIYLPTDTIVLNIWLLTSLTKPLNCSALLFLPFVSWKYYRKLDFIT